MKYGFFILWKSLSGIQILLYFEELRLYFQSFRYKW